MTLEKAHEQNERVRHWACLRNKEGSDVQG